MIIRLAILLIIIRSLKGWRRYAWVFFCYFFLHVLCLCVNLWVMTELGGLSRGCLHKFCHTTDLVVTPAFNRHVVDSGDWFDIVSKTNSDRVRLARYAATKRRNSCTSYFLLLFQVSGSGLPLFIFFFETIEVDNLARLAMMCYRGGERSITKNRQHKQRTAEDTFNSKRRLSDWYSFCPNGSPRVRRKLGYVGTNSFRSSILKKVFSFGPLTITGLIIASLGLKVWNRPGSYSSILSGLAATGTASLRPPPKLVLLIPQACTLRFWSSLPS